MCVYSVRVDYVRLLRMMWYMVDKSGIFMPLMCIVLVPCMYLVHALYVPPFGVPCIRILLCIPPG